MRSSPSAANMWRGRPASSSLRDISPRRTCGLCRSCCCSALWRDLCRRCRRTGSTSSTTCAPWVRRNTDSIGVFQGGVRGRSPAHSGVTPPKQISRFGDEASAFKMIYIRNILWLKWGTSLCFVLFLLNHVEPLIRDRIRAAAGTGTINVNVQVEGGLVGHNSIGIDEGSLSGGGERFLHFATLGQWEYRRDAPIACPAPIQALSGQPFSS